MDVFAKPCSDEGMADNLQTDLNAPRHNLKAAADFLGLSTSGLRTLIRQGRGPASFRVGKLLRFSKSDLVAFAEQHRRPAA